MRDIHFLSRIDEVRVFDLGIPADQIGQIDLKLAGDFPKAVALLNGIDAWIGRKGIGLQVGRVAGTGGSGGGRIRREIRIGL